MEIEHEKILAVDLICLAGGIHQPNKYVLEKQNGIKPRAGGGGTVCVYTVYNPKLEMTYKSEIEKKFFETSPKC